MESIGKIDRSKKGQVSAPNEPNRSVVGYTGTSINIANAMARAIESGAFPKASGSGSMAYDSDLAPRKESQSTLPGAPSSDEQPNVKVSGGKRKKPPTRRGAAAGSKEAQAKLVQRAAEDAMDESETNVSEGSDAEREIKSRRLMSPTEALLDSAQAAVPAPELRDRRHSTATRRQTTFTLKPPRGDSTDRSSGGLSDGRPRNGIRGNRSPESSVPRMQNASLVNRYGSGRRHRTSQSPGSTSTTSQFHSFSAIVATGRSGVTGMDSTVEEEESIESAETSGASTSKQNTTSISVSALHEESSYEAMEKEIQANRISEANAALASRPAQPMETPRQILFNPPQSTSSSLHQQESTNVSRQPFFPIPVSNSNPHIPSSANRRRARQSTDNEAYRPIGGTSSVNTQQPPRAATDSADEDGGGEGLAAHLPERSTRGKRHEQGEGYLGTGLSFTPNSSGKARPKKSDSGRLDSVDAEEQRERDVSYQNVVPVEEPKISVASNPKRGTKFNTPARAGKSVTIVPSPIKENIPESVTVAAKPAYEKVDVDVAKKLRQPPSPLHRVCTVLSNIWKEPLKWVGAIIALLAAIAWLASRVPASEVSHRGQPSSQRMPFPTGHVRKDHDIGETSDGMGFLLDRMAALEDTLASLTGDLQASKQEQERSKLEVEIASSKMEQLSGDLQDERAKRIEQSKELDQLRTTMRTLRQQSEHSTASISSQVDAVDERVNRVESSVKDALSEQRMMQLLGRILPNGVPVRREPETGQVTIDPAFWTEMRKVLATKADVDLLSSKVSIIKKKQDADVISTTSTEVPAVAKTPSWQDFLDENEEQLRAWAERAFDRKILDTEIIDRSTFLSMLKDELYAVQAALRDEASNREHATMAKVNKKLDHIRSQHAAETMPQPVISLGNADADIKPVLQRLIDDSILKYSKDTLARPDFALGSGGAQIIHDQTTKTMDLVRAKGAWSWLMGERRFGLLTLGRMPEIILHPSSLPGMCWPFDGSKGEVGINLSRETRVTDITVEHAARELVTAKSLASAPKDIEVWAYFAEDRAEELQDFLDRYPTHQADLEPPQKGGGLLLISRFQYSPHTSQPIQSFAVHSDVRSLNLATSNVIIRVNSNWGAEYTCMYRVRIHGAATEDLGEESADDAR